MGAPTGGAEGADFGWATACVAWGVRIGGMGACRASFSQVRAKNGNLKLSDSAAAVALYPTCSVFIVISTLCKGHGKRRWLIETVGSEGRTSGGDQLQRLGRLCNRLRPERGGPRSGLGGDCRSRCRGSDDRVDPLAAECFFGEFRRPHQCIQLVAFRVPMGNTCGNQCGTSRRSQ